LRVVRVHTLFRPLITAQSSRSRHLRDFQTTRTADSKPSPTCSTAHSSTRCTLRSCCAHRTTHTLMLQDFVGHKGRIGPGDVQWMTAGRGIVHCEMPATSDARGLQLWVNLAAKDKMCEPRYQVRQLHDVLRPALPSHTPPALGAAGQGRAECREQRCACQDHCRQGARNREPRVYAHANLLH
jgi:hypothetical protein